jgi:hypothetical protein
VAPTLTPVWTADELEAELRRALELVDVLAPPDDLREPLFVVASNALLQRVVEPPPRTFPIGELGLGRGRG